MGNKMSLFSRTTQVSQSPRGILLTNKICTSKTKEIWKDLSDHCSIHQGGSIETETRISWGFHLTNLTLEEWLGSLKYLTASNQTLYSAVMRVCADIRLSLTKKHLEAIKRIFRYLKGTINMGLWYPKDNAMSLTAYADADHAGCQDSRRSTLGSAQFLGDRLGYAWSIKEAKKHGHLQQQRRKQLQCLAEVSNPYISAKRLSTAFCCNQDPLTVITKCHSFKSCTNVQTLTSKSTL
ncbi:hypothetical protein Tco_0374596 [Tanacetum coccineum]